MGLYKTIHKSEVAEIEVKKSKFIAEVRHVTTEEEAEDIIKEMKKKYYDARHHCSAYLLRSDGGLRHSSDDGEPSGTAGKPILDVLVGAGITDVIVVVTRYFGGTLLGTGGLVRAYSGAAKEVLGKARVTEIIEANLLQFSLSYPLFPKVQHLCKEMNIILYETDYSDVVQTSLLIEPDLYKKFFKELTELTAGVISEESIVKKRELFYYMDEDEKVIILKGEVK